MLSAYIASTHINYIYDVRALDTMSGLRSIITVVTLVFGLIMPFIILADRIGDPTPVQHGVRRQR